MLFTTLRRAELNANGVSQSVSDAITEQPA
jgi:hypothetical protein